MTKISRLRKTFSVNFSHLDRWNVSLYQIGLWHWPSSYIRSVSEVTTCENIPISIKDVKDKKISIIAKINFSGELYLRNFKDCESYKGKLFIVKPGRIIFSKINARQGCIYYVPKDQAIFAVSNEYPVLRVNETQIIGEYLDLALRAGPAKNILKGAASGMAKARTYISDVQSLKIPVPPLPIQQKIVDYWQANNITLHEDIEKAHEITKDIPSLLATQIGLLPMGGAHSKRSFVFSWNEIDRWGVSTAREMSRQPNFHHSQFPVVALADVIRDLQNGWSPKCMTRQAIAEEWGVLKVGAVSFGWFDESQNKALPEGLKPRIQYEVKSGDLIVSRANIAQYVGACALVNQVRPKLMLCDKLFRVIWKKDSPVLPKYLAEILKTPHLRWQIENRLTGASPTMKNISKPALLALQFPLPPLDVQEDIISNIEKQRFAAQLLTDTVRERKKRVSMEIEQMILGTRPVEVC